MRVRVFGILGVAAAIILLAPRIVSYALSNAGFVALNQDTSGESLAFATDRNFTFSLAEEFDPKNPSAQRGLGRTNVILRELDAAERELRAGGFTIEALIGFASRANNANDLNTALNWLLIAKEFESNNPELWLTIGKVCQKLRFAEDICSEFIIVNNGNLLVNSDFKHVKDGWQTRHEPGYELRYSVDPCPADFETQCATIETGAVSPELGATWLQCLTLEPGESYRFSAWVKAELPSSSEWRPVYIQGAIGARPKGIWPGSQYGSSQWQYWEQVFDMVDFDHNHACFHPVRLMDNGKVWFKDAMLTSLN